MGERAPPFRPESSANLTFTIAFTIIRLKKIFQVFLMEAQDSGAKSQEYLVPQLLIKLTTSGAGRGSKETCIECPLHARHQLGAPPSGTHFTFTEAL